MEYSNYPYQEPEKKNPSLWKVLLAGCGCLLIVGILAGFLFSRFFSFTNRPKRVIQTQIDAINEGNHRLAYSYFSTTYQKTVSPSDFRERLKSFTPWLPIREVHLGSVRIRNNRALIDGTLSGSSGVIFPVHYELVQEKEEWKILDYEWVPPGDLLSI